MSQDRLQRILARAGVASRRASEELIRQGRVSVNGRVATLGERADAERDAIKVDGRRVKPTVPRRYLLLNKPRRYVTTRADPEGRTTVYDLVPPGWRRGLVPVGRLDYDSEGLLVLTDDGDFAHRLSHPSFGCTKTYEVKVKGVPERSAVERLRQGVTLAGRRTAPARVSLLRKPRPERREVNSWWTVELVEGRTRQVREMFRSVGHPVQRLRRVAIGGLSDPRLGPGGLRELTLEERRRLAGEGGANRRRGRARRAAPEGGTPRRTSSPGGRSEPRPRRVGEASPAGHDPGARALVVAIDGPAGVGKSTVARLVAEQLGLTCLETGAMYRGVALKAMEQGVDPGDRAAVEGLLADLDLRLEGRPGQPARVLLDGRPLGRRSRLPEVSDVTSRIAVYPQVRRELVARQRAFAERQGAVLEGRDTGSRVVPETPHKFFLTAPVEVRLERRRGQLAPAGAELSVAAMEKELRRRDHRDTHRAESPLVRDDSYFELDTGALDAEQVAAEIVRRVRSRAGGWPGSGPSAAPPAS